MKRFLKRAIKSIFTTYRSLTRICSPKALDSNQILQDLRELSALPGNSVEQKRDFEVVKRKYKNVIDIITYDNLLERLRLTIEQIKKI